ncbi:unnamed protein product [Paramecium sonneborni]|uniref:PSI domain-containing protein n=1 Tax=Paramecium sonneborni TaxID=65129 RepID=A0A8S1NP01_9CILI|nr:unnamed protein product [Paramecium sonneborni]
MMIFLVVLLQIVKSQVCSCVQLKSQQDCQQNIECQWMKQVCQNNENKTIGSYCRQFDKQKCSQMLGCMYYEGQCQQFTGCRSFEYSNEEQCKSIQISCITDGQTCIDLGECVQYVDKNTCKQNIRNQLCYWDGKKCSLADTCQKLPYESDEQCRKAKSQCTVNFGENGCMDGGNCKDMQKQSQCYWNKSMTIKCKWINSKCYDHICLNAPKTLTTDAECESFLQGCTTQKGGGCTTRTTCSKAQNQNACIIDANNNQCTWMDTYCSDRYCSQASKTFTTNSQCDSFLKGCIAKPDGGCLQNKECDSALSQDTCQYDIHGKQCVWNKTICQLKICKNAPIINNMSHYYCESFIPSCTMLNNLCVTKTCDNAPTIITNCTEYLTGCISKLNGGCSKLTTCNSIIKQQDCIHDSNQQLCLWFNDKCIDQLCTAIQKPLNQDCNSILQNCINDSNGNCMDYRCSHIQTLDLCTIDYYQQKCIWKSVCYLKTCSNAPQNLNTHLLCNTYLSNCTVNQHKRGCMDITNTCEAYQIQEQCIKKLDNTQCEWFNEQCLSKSCETADINQYTTMQLCDQYLSGCVVQSTLKGCMKLPQKCNLRSLSEVCLFDNTCYWYEDQCIEKSNTCLNTPEPFCNSGCVWSNSQCVSNLCHLIPNQSHSMCNAINNTCTVNENRTACINLLQKCSDYKQSYQCFLSKTQKCYWNGTECLEFQCSDIPDDPIQFNSFEKCQNISNNCTVIPLLNQTGCLNRLEKCESYTFNQCTYTLEGKKCVWLDGLCQQFDKLTCQSIVDYSNCDSILFQCKQQKEICVNKTCTEIQVEDFSLNYQKCQSYDKNCSIHASLNSCIEIQNDCNQYLKEEHCIQSKQSLCHYYNDKCVNRDIIYGCSTVRLENYNDIKCKEFKQFCKLNSISNGCADTGCVLYYGLTTLNECETVDNTCTVNAARTGCTTKVQLCSSLDQNNCIKAQEGFCAWVEPDCLLFNNHPCTSITLFQYSHSLCSSVSITCTTNAQQNQCINMPEECPSYTQSDCFQSKNSFCFYNGILCVSISTITNCSDIKANTKLICDRYDGSQNPQAICTFQTGNSNCTSRTCQNYPDNKFTHENCSTWLAGCTQNVGKTSCINIQKSCDLYVMESNCFKSEESYCQFKGSCQNIDNNICDQIPSDERCTQNSVCIINNLQKCVDKTCENYNNNVYNKILCQQFKTTCTILKDSSKCMTVLENCTNYQIENQCTISNKGNCIWFQNKCVDASCENVVDCNGNNCIVKRQGGCTNLQQECQQYETNSQCKKSMKSICYWNGSYCVDLICNNLKGIGFNSFNDCDSILKSCTIDGSKVLQCMTKKECSQYKYEMECKVDQKDMECQWKNNSCYQKQCTVVQLNGYNHINCMNQIINNKQKICTINDNGNGCMELKQCQQYKSDKNCIIDNSGQQCGWKNNECNLKSCETAPQNVSTHEDCQKYENNCTINLTNDGCVKIPEQCSQMIETQCKTSNCVWIDSQCQIKTCQNAPESLKSEQQCNSYLKDCGYVGQQKCYNFECEDIELKNHEDCYQQYKCTSNGMRCIALQEQCYYYITQTSCVMDTSKKQCTWVESSMQCQTRRCDNAPQSLSTNEDCNNYYTNCTTKAGGGCQILQDLCKSYTNQQSCVKTVFNTLCVWDQNTCRDKSCIDLFGYTHTQCNIQDINCTIGLQGKCAIQNLCSSKTSQETCIIGTDGPCLWIIQHNIGGACYQYNDCTSIKWKTDQLCKFISPLCTTNGDNCIPILKCSQNKIPACFTGIDGECILTIDSRNNQVCSLFKNCTQAKFKTHEECQLANTKCTTNTIDSCISLYEKCSSYQLLEQCKRNKFGIQYTQDHYISSTGICVWESGKCRDQSCQDLQGYNHQECSKQLISCTYNSINCISILKCSQYQDQITCSTAIASDGICLWDKTICRIKLCTDISQPKSSNDCQSNLNFCIYDETNLICIPKSNCSSYSTQSICQQGALTGQCIWNNNKCVPFTQCNLANSSQSVCISNSYCNWVTKITNQQNSTNTTISYCENFNCTTWYNTKQKCEPFLAFDQSKYNYCKFNNNTCISIDESQFDSTNCYTFSKYSQTWDTTLQKCVICHQSLPNSNNSSNINNSTVDDFANIVEVYLLIILIISN